MIVSRYKFLATMGRTKFEAAKCVILDDDYMAELFRSAQVLDTNDDICKALLAKLVSAGVFTQVELDALLAKCVAE